MDAWYLVNWSLLAHCIWHNNSVYHVQSRICLVYCKFNFDFLSYIFNVLDDFRNLWIKI